MCACTVRNFKKYKTKKYLERFGFRLMTVLLDYQNNDAEISLVNKILFTARIQIKIREKYIDIKN